MLFFFQGQLRFSHNHKIWRDEHLKKPVIKSGELATLFAHSCCLIFSLSSSFSGSSQPPKSIPVLFPFFVPLTLFVSLPSSIQGKRLISPTVPAGIGRCCSSCCAEQPVRQPPSPSSLSLLCFEHREDEAQRRTGALFPWLLLADCSHARLAESSTQRSLGCAFP